jgi:hypothetical protein
MTTRELSRAWAPSWVAAVIAVVSLGIGTPATAVDFVDQMQLVSDIQWAYHSASAIGQTFTVGEPGRLAAIELSIGAFGPPAEDTLVSIYDYSSGALGTLLGSVVLTPPQVGPVVTTLQAGTVTATLVELDSLAIRVAPGDRLAFHLTTAAGPGSWAIRGQTTDAYADGVRLAGTNPQPTSDLMFKTFVSSIFADGFESGGTTNWSSAVP